VTRSGAVLRAAAVFVFAGAALSTAQDGAAPEPRYGDTPEALLPHRGFGEPARRFFREAPAFRGPGVFAESAATKDAVRLGVIAPLSGEDVELGRRMQDGIALAVEEANAAGGYAAGVPFEVLVRDENKSWGAAGDAAVDLVTNEGVAALVGAFEDGASHVMTRVILKLEVPMVNTAGTDPTLTEHMIPWLVRVRPDDRQTCYALARRIVETDRRERIVVFRANDRYARAGIGEFNDAVRRLRRPVLLEERWLASERSWPSQIERLRAARPDAIVVWGRAAQAGRVVRALRDAGLTQPVYGPERLADEAFARAAGGAAEGAVCTYPFDTRRTDPAWTSFVGRFRARFGRDPDPVASYAYDGVAYLVRAIREAGTDRAKIRDRLFAPATFDGVTGTARFDVTHNNVRPPLFGHVEHGKFILE
jgi:branched-chain amino acid transport system substrate-binding protein